MGEIAAKIDAIINQRKTHVPEIEATLERLNQCQAAVAKLNAFKASYTKDDDLKIALGDISTSAFSGKIAEYKRQLENLVQRFSRNELHISFVGQAGQGKSCVMQKISGLSKEIIPSSDGFDCTGAKSIITNVGDSEVHAEIEFFTQNEIINIVNKYIETIFSNAVSKVGTLSEIKNLDKQTLQSKIPSDNADSQEKFDHLKKYIEHLFDFEEKLGSKITVKKEDIEKYVAQYKNNSPSEKYYNYLGVKEANIKCHFPYDDAGKIVLVDTIGLGATSIGVEESMDNTIKSDSDAIVLMFRPEEKRPRIDDRVTSAINHIRELVSEKYSRKMLFWIINKMSGQNSAYNETVDGIFSRIKSQNHPIADVFLVDCMNTNEVQEKLLKPILEHLSAHILEADQILIDNTQKTMEECYDSFREIANRLDKAGFAAVAGDFKKQYGTKINDTFDKGILGNLREYYNVELNPKSETPCEEFKKAIEQKLKNIFSFIPNEGDIESYAERGSVVSENVYAYFSNHIRNKIIDDFYTLDECFEKIVNKMKSEVVDIFTSEDKGRLTYIVNPDGLLPNEWISEFQKVANESDYPYIYEALEKFKNFSVKTEGFLIFKVRNALSKIDPMASVALQHKSNATKEAREELAKEIIGWFKEYLYAIKQDIEKNVQPLYSVPNEAMCAAVKNLYDRVTFAKDSENQYFALTEEWKEFYDANIKSIFPEESSKFEKHQGISKDWKDISNEMKNLNNLKTFKVGV